MARKGATKADKGLQIYIKCDYREKITMVAARGSREPRDRAGPLGTHFRRGSRNAGREAGAAKDEGPLECEQGGWGRTRGGVPWNAGRGAGALSVVVGQKSPICISNLPRRPGSQA